MGVDKQVSKGGGGYVGGILQLFDWNAKSRKKLFSNKSNLPEQLKQKKRSDRNLPRTRLHLVMDEDEIAAGSRFKASSDYSCASSLTDEEISVTKAPGVVARLMGLDSLPTSNLSEPYSTPFFDSQSLRDAHFHRKNLECHHEHQSTRSGNLHNEVDAPIRNAMEPRPQKIINRPIEKFQTESLPPKSAKSIPISHHKLLSPIKSPSFIQTKNAANIMEAAAKIIEMGPQMMTTKAKIPLVGSSSVPLRVRDLKEKVEAAQNQRKPAEVSRKPVENNAAKYLKAQSTNNGWNGSVDTTLFMVSSSSEEFSVGLKNKGKSVSLALQAKVNVQKREGLNSSGNKNLFDQQEQSEVTSIHLFKSQPNTQKNSHKKPSTHNLLRQNNQKQNCLTDRGKVPSKPLTNSQGRKTVSGGDSAFGRQKISGKSAVNSKVVSRKSSVESKKEVPFSNKTNVLRKKRSIDGVFHIEKNQDIDNMLIDNNKKPIKSSELMSWAEDIEKKGIDVVSFTFTAPMTRSVSGRNISSREGEVVEKSNAFRADYRSKKVLLNSDVTNSSKFSLGYNLIEGDALNTLLEQKLRELTRGLEYHIPTGVEEMEACSSNDADSRKLLDSRHPSPISVLEHSFFTESCNSSDTVETNFSTRGSKLCSSVQAQEVLGTRSSRKFHSIEADTELSDSASSTVLSMKDSKGVRNWELEYVKDILSSMELMFKDFALGRAREIINPHLFYQLESRKLVLQSDQDKPMERRKVLFDCVRECMDIRCRTWAKGLFMVRRKEGLAEEVYGEISAWKGMGDCMVDELVDKDMSSQCGKWLDFEVEEFEMGMEIEGWILRSLLDEVVTDILPL